MRSIGIAETFAPMLIGVLLDAVFLGILIVQTYIYFSRYGKDSIWFKILVAYLMVAEFANTMFDIALIWQPLITLGGAMHGPPTFLPADAITTTLISTPVQIFLAWRLYVITKSKILPIIGCCLSVCSLAGGMFLCSVVLSRRDMFNRSGPGPAAAITWLVASSVTDVVITGGLVWALNSRRGGMKTPFDSYVTRVIRMSVQTGALTALAVCSDAVIFIAVQGGNYFFAWDLILSKLYTNSLLASLNARPSSSEESETRQPALFIDDIIKAAHLESKADSSSTVNEV
ncbi:hypothetical protein Moror_16827 [Moniliophthora roreri MCA 2997]|uniref:DUF6534 domain-containing protein n=2 Tax=Moniliophthora roreri TaxID=221103 RepID=V2XBB2_MONRO|nr:hypothetical protein Moror_16827 [Moniliophthora roreri MCA 2997]